MGIFDYSSDEQRLNKILKMNQDDSVALLNDAAVLKTRAEADANIDSSVELLKSLGMVDSVQSLSSDIKAKGEGRKLEHRPVIESWDSIAREAERRIPVPVELEDIMSEAEIDAAFQERKEINRSFSKKTSIINKTDLSFLAIATALQVAKSLIFPYIAEKFNYGNGIDKSSRLEHDDKAIKDAQKGANDRFRDKKLKKNKEGYWVNILYQKVPYDTTRGSPDIGVNMEGKYHRMHTLGHDPIMGWIFGTMNILTDIITLNTFTSYRVSRKPMRITKEMVPMGMMFSESYECIKSDFLNLPAALFAQKQHLKSDEYTKLGLPVPLLSSINEVAASQLYKNDYDALCFARDLKIIGASFAVSKIFDIIISLVHGFFRKDDVSKELYEVRTRKILLVSNSIASASTIINASITKNPKKLDIGSLLNTVSHLFTDIRFVSKIKQEFVRSEISDRLQVELAEVDRLYENIICS